MTTLVWFRDDLRTHDNPALSAAADAGDPVICVYVLDEESDGLRPHGGAAKWWLHESLASLTRDLERLGLPLVLRRGPAERVIADVIASAGVTRVLWNRRYGGVERTIDGRLKELAHDHDTTSSSSNGSAGLQIHSFNGSLLFEPWEIVNGSGQPYKVFTPFWKACLNAPEPREPLPEPTTLRAADVSVPSDVLADWNLQPAQPNWAQTIAQEWTPGQGSAHELLGDFLDGPVDTYKADRDVPSKPATSRLSPHLRWGEISPHQVWHHARRSGRNVETFLSELGWREFAWHTLFRWPNMATQNLDARFDHFPWHEPDPRELAAWQQGRTGFPLVDAGMRELWQTGTMHNRVRMVVASFLVKNLRIDWRIGEQWFWDTLVDADAASNPFNWQWVAGCGADAAPYFRVFNPETQAKKFDPNGRYVARWAPDSPTLEPLVDLKESRAAALEAYEFVKTAVR